MSKMKSYAPDWPDNDFLDYYLNTIILDPETGKPAHVTRVENGMVSLRIYNDGKEHELRRVSRSAITWKHLAYPKVGWTSLMGLPAYAVRRPLRDRSKGLCYKKLHWYLPPVVGGIVTALLGKQGLGWIPDGTFFKLVTAFGKRYELDVLTDCFYKTNRTNPPGKAITSVVEGGQLFEFISPRCIVMTNPDTTKEYDKYAAMILYGPSIVGYVRKDGTLRQSSDFPLDLGFEDANSAA